MHPADGSADGGPYSDSVSSLGQLMCRVHAGDTAVFAALMDEAQPQWAPYRQWGRSTATTEDLLQELWLTLWQELQRHLPSVLQPLCGDERGGD